MYNVILNKSIKINKINIYFTNYQLQQRISMTNAKILRSIYVADVERQLQIAFSLKRLSATGMKIVWSAPAVSAAWEKLVPLYTLKPTWFSASGIIWGEKKNVCKVIPTY